MHAPEVISTREGLRILSRSLQSGRRRRAHPRVAGTRMIAGGRGWFAVILGAIGFRVNTLPAVGELETLAGIRGIILMPGRVLVPGLDLMWRLTGMTGMVGLDQLDGRNRLTGMGGIGRIVRGDWYVSAVPMHLRLVDLLAEVGSRTCGHS